jgi:hypothetical protein
MALEASGKIFAYQVTYLLAETNEGQIVKSYPQPLSFYYVDATGEGDFGLFNGPMPLGLVPEWVRDLVNARKKH